MRQGLSTAAVAATLLGVVGAAAGLLGCSADGRSSLFDPYAAEQRKLIEEADEQRKLMEAADPEWFEKQSDPNTPFRQHGGII